MQITIHASSFATQTLANNLPGLTPSPPIGRLRYARDLNHIDLLRDRATNQQAGVEFCSECPSPKENQECLSA
ncbi:hypothetical protein AWB78_01098 [Caballeronia calidae]|uniref:Uncharacterized protein n=1 Tax=Caballeronia calidae TaxID=1777139 RepID=A0A157ZZQ8_9BURK|nr:hypothetical protein AWB78_01098 [Caballeronia calidae]